MAIIRNRALNPGTVDPIGNWDGGSTANYIYGTTADDIIYGTNNADQIYGGKGRDRLYGGSGSDLLDGGADADTLDGGAGIDTVSYVSSSAGVTIGNLAVGLTGDAQGDVISNVENALGSNFADLIEGNAGANLIYGLGGNDLLFGGGGSDALYGGAGNDTLEGGIGIDTLYGGADNDTLEGGAAADHLFGEDGFDTVSYSKSSAGVTVDLRGGQVFGGDAQGDVLSSIEGVTGSGHQDLLLGNATNNQLRGGAGADTLYGDAGNDWLQGDAGVDTLTGDLAGIVGRDTFAFDTRLAGERDTIVDFQQGFDFIAITGMTRAEAFGTDGKLARGYYKDSTGEWKFESIDRGDKVYYDTETNTLCTMDPRFGDGKVRLARDDIKEIVIAEGGHHLSETDFVFFV
jgi:Ca2+-binding RTX toxin-like protein